MSKFDKKIKAHKLRKQGLSINVIAKKLNVSKSTTSVWCSTVVLTTKQKEKLAKNQAAAGFQGRVKGAVFQRQRKIDNIEFYNEKAGRTIGTLSNRDLLLAGVSLFWAEGSKSDSTTGFVFVNSDPQMILFMKKFLREILFTKDEDLICTIQINKVHEPRILKILSFWSTLLELPLSQFNKPYYVNIRPKKVYENYDSYYGVLRLKVKKSTNYKYYMLGLIAALKSNMPV